MGIGITELLVIGGIAVLFFGGKRIPELGRGMGEAIKNFKAGMAEVSEADKIAKDKKDKKDIKEKEINS